MAGKRPRGAGEETTLPYTIENIFQASFYQHDLPAVWQRPERRALHGETGRENGDRNVSVWRVRNR